MSAGEREPSDAGETRDAETELGTLTRALAATVRRAGAMGLGRLERPAPPPTPVSVASTEPTRGATPTATPRARRDAAPAPAAAKPVDSAGAAENRQKAAACADIVALRELVSGCQACELCQTRTQTVFADGTGKARVLFIGEAPGQNEDEQGVPFVGRAGALLTDIIEKGMGLARQDVTIANVLKCRPPGNRDPRPEEKELCTPFLDRQIELLDPAVIITLGLHASQHILRSSLSMGRLRGRVHQVGGRKVVATYHPAFLLRSPSMKKPCWEDIQLAMTELGLRPTPKRDS